MVCRASILLVLASLPACFNPGQVQDTTPDLDPETTAATTTTADDSSSTSTTTPTSLDGMSVEPSTSGEPDPSTGVVDTGSTGTVDACEPNPCVHGTCSSESGTASCTCDEGWAGDACDACDRGFVLEGDECVAVMASCDDDPCGTGASCEVQDDVVVCTRVFGLTGGDQPWAVPPGVTSVDVTALAASGGCGLAGWGGEAVATVPVMPGDALHVYVGGAGACSVAASLPGGYNGGGNKFTDDGDFWEGGSGGGATDLRRNGTSLAERVLVAGGGGGQGWGGQAGHGGGVMGETCNGVNGGCNDATCGGRGGTQAAGGIGGVCNEDCVGAAGSLGQGGNSFGCAAAGGGGGGGYYGGGGGAHCSGGGGSSRVDFPGNSNTSTTPGMNAGDGQLTLVWRP
jgi:hypothetical protein